MARVMCVVSRHGCSYTSPSSVLHGLGTHPPTGLRFLTGKGDKYRETDMVERAKVIGHRKCQGLIGLQNFFWN